MDKPNVIFIVIDTLRKDHAKLLEKEFKKFGFVSYDNAIAPSPWTTPSHASIFTGLYPAFHGVHETRDEKDIEVKFKNNSSTLSLQLQNIGYKTYLLSANPYIRPEFGFIGFDHFYESLFMPRFFVSNKDNIYIKKLRQKYRIDTRVDLIKLLINSKKYRLLGRLMLNYSLNNIYIHFYSKIKNWPMDKGITNIIKVFRRILTNIKNNPKFIFLNLMEVHEPYSIDDVKGDRIFIDNLKTNELNNDVAQRWRDKYPREVRYVTKKLSKLMGLLMDMNIFDDSLIIITSDHGQLLGEYGRIGHGTFLYDELLKIPLLIKYPKNTEIEITKQDSKYIGLATLNSFIMNVLENKIRDDSILYGDVVFSESYGIHVSIGKLSGEEEKRNIKQLEKYRIAVYYRKFKGIFDVEKWDFEEVLSYDPDMEVTDDVIKHMRRDIVRFLKTVTAVKVPKIKP